MKYFIHPFINMQVNKSKNYWHYPFLFFFGLGMFFGLLESLPSGAAFLEPTRFVICAGLKPLAIFSYQSRFRLFNGLNSNRTKHISERTQHDKLQFFEFGLLIGGQFGLAQSILSNCFSQIELYMPLKNKKKAKYSYL